MRSPLARFATVVAAAVIAGLTLAPAALAATDDVQRGRALYERKCAACHGAAGRGDGPAHFVLFPQPRDLTSGTFKIRSTPTLPTDDDLFGVITRGIPGTAMPGWSGLSARERRDLVAYVKSLSPVFAERRAPSPTRIPAPPPPSPALLALGEKFYAEAECFKCHGAAGRGDGPSADTLKDEWGAPIVPYDFTIPGRMKGGNTVRDVYRALANGIGGTPMPSYGDALSPQETWGLAYYVMSLARGAAPAPAAEEGVIRVRRVAGDLPPDPGRAVWRQAGLRAVPLRTLWLRPEQVGQVRVAALHNGREIGILLEWDDPVSDAATLAVEEFRDAVAVQFPLHAAAAHAAGHPEPTYVMGEPAGPVNIWHWKADWQLDVASHADRENRYPAIVVDDVPFVRGVRSSDPAAARAPADRHDPLFLTARAAGNAMALPRRSAVENLAAVGVGTVASLPPEAQVVSGEGRWADGTWRVVVVRALRTESRSDAQFAPGRATSIAFAVWDGAHRDRNGQKAVSVWQRLLMDR